ncbi:hypothetical protein ACJX0J_010193, partial [Zea mays]
LIQKGEIGLGYPFTMLCSLITCHNLAAGGGGVLIEGDDALLREQKIAKMIFNIEKQYDNLAAQTTFLFIQSLEKGIEGSIIFVGGENRQKSLLVGKKAQLLGTRTIFKKLERDIRAG